ncbi:DNA replication and repair protein RecO [Candidatus Kryptonium thompsonii]|mgnify:CR=1 FL=1|jgi:DNA repair protein RecO (recombination protein O)|uniref:DNA repair protein RecO n=2 Tax=Candidatus Kryptonium thompsonii TaxID=1633631 RepID=A0A0P1M916_9BACT|nr:DNA repair protein RecO [Candidatus Kryptonium thompsoni]CUS77604.1 DNA replication and repair protein RecO [Candidatus Kryptonium thompsoni]CUS78059.1 DNA replication and repair protein RecO [Candidatus Kryptonium thompsoni]CUS86499.1 DNA replication and repair protein RecO [Candidatus Kryptonium thompsoni]CUS87900.1 DNA replication and repair protein RecO [Candidatus Kryptonium thompsoni]CUS90414.1 DNA replication and repair protein RecO [Candidatus Kryptonium thompsoni]
MLTKTEAVVLKAVKYRETSKIVTLYTKKFGKINAVAKGAMLTTSKFGASLEPMSYILAVLYKKETREVQFLSQADLIKPFLSLYSDYNKMILGLSICELVYKLMKFEEENLRIFNLLVNTLEKLNEAEKNEVNFLWFFIIHLLDVSGFKINFTSCISCGEKFSDENLSKKVVFLSDRGGFMCSKCSSSMKASDYSVATFKSLAWLEKAKIENVTNLKIQSNINNEIHNLLMEYMSKHFGELVNLKSVEVYYKL